MPAETANTEPANSASETKRQTNKEKGYTNLRVSMATRDRLNEIGSRGESYEDIIKRLLLREVIG